MADFVIVIATAALLVGPAVPGATASAPAPGAVVSSVPANAPTVGFRTYPDAASCEPATAAQVAPAGARLVCVPVDPPAGNLASPY